MTARENKEELPSPPKPMRLQRFLAQCGLGSRRDCEELITSGRVTIDGAVADQLGTTVEPATQTVSLDGERLKVERKKYFMLNKPSGYLCTADDPEGRRLVLDLFPEEGPRLFTVGRLDENTTGLIIVTNDGDLAQKLAHPRYRIFRTYEAQVAGQPRPEIYEQLRQGLYFTEGKFRVYSVKPIKKQKDSTWVEIVMTEGQNREIRRLFARVGHKIMKLERQGYGPLRLGRLNRGEYRELTREELASFHAVLERNRAEEGRDAPPRGRTAGPALRSRPRPPSTEQGRARPARGEKFQRDQRSSREDSKDRGDRPVRGEKRSDRPQRPGSGERSERIGREQGERPQRRQRSDSTEGSARGSTFGRTGKPPRTDRASSGERPERRNRSDFAERADRGKSLERGERKSRPQRTDGPGAGDRPQNKQTSRGKKPAFGERPERGASLERGERKSRPQRTDGPGAGDRLQNKQSGRGKKPAFGERSERTARHTPGRPATRRPGGKPGKRRPPRQK